MQKILRPHIESTIERIKKRQVVLAVQDTTSLNYSAHSTTTGQGPINTRSDKAVGLILHDTLALTTEGTPLGLLDVQCWARDPKEAGKSERRSELPIEGKESFPDTFVPHYRTCKWLRSYRAVNEVQKLCPDTMLVSVGDREADIYELFYETTLSSDSPEELVRAEKSRNRKVDQVKLWDKIKSEPVAGYREIYVPRKKSRPALTARLEIRFALVTLEPPKEKKHLPPVEVWVVYARETVLSG